MENLKTLLGIRPVVLILCDERPEHAHARARTEQVGSVGVSSAESDVTACLSRTCIYLQSYVPI